MKIECDKCGAKYSIADDKVRGKTFKIRCKKCSNVIIVRDKAGGAEDGGDAPADEPGWHLAIGGETVGPISEAEVRERFAAGEIDRETSVWQEGFEDWLPLGEVSAFADLAERPAAGGQAAAAAAAAPDPFAGSSDDYSAPSSSSSDFGHSAEPARTPAAASQSAASSGPSPSASGSGASPRVSSLTGARNENSVLFSLDSLSSMAMGKPSGGAAPSGPSFSLGGGGGGGSPASATSNSEGSGLIDIRAMSGMMGGGGGGGGGGGSDEGRDDSMLPSFGGTGFGGLSAAPLLVQPAAPVVEQAPASEPPRSSNAPLYALMAVLLLGMGFLTWYIVTRPEPQPETKIVEVIKSVEVREKGDDEDEDKPKKKKKKTEEEEEDEADEPEDSQAGDDKKGTTKASTSTKKTDTKKTDKTDTKSSAVGDSPKTDTKKDEKKEEKKDDYSVDCILDPSKCKKSSSSSSSDSGSSSKPPVDSSLPDKLELPDIQAGVNPAKAAAKTNCSKHAKGGEKVSIKLSISGPSGTVLSSTVVDAAGNDGLANCVAAELKKATFKKVKKEQIGTQVSVSF
jgi:predicted Zn finger-like uncharacterized protein